MRKQLKTYGMVQNVVCRLLFMKLFGVKLFPVELLRHQRQVIFLVKTLKIMKICAVLEGQPPECASIMWITLSRKITLDHW